MTQVSEIDMSDQTDVLHELIRCFNAREPIDIARYFTPDFELDDPGSGARRSGHAGARDMAEAVAKLGHEVKLEILHMIEQGDYVAVRYAVTSRGAEPRAMMGLYRFVDARIAEDWGISTHSPWRR